MWARNMGRGGFEPPKALGQLIYSQSRLTASVSARPRDFTDNRPVPNRRLILWQGLTAPSLERFMLTPSGSGFELRGLILQTDRDVAYVVRYAIGVDQSWFTRKVDVEVENGGRRTVKLSRTSGGLWSRDGRTASDLAGCDDIDLEWSPSTNTLPIRRLRLPLDGAAELTAAWIRFPSLEIERLDQSYERLAGRRYRYRSGRFTAELEVDADGLVLDYAGLWKAVATTGDLSNAASTSADPETRKGR
jgi:uncharacterized protein